MGRKLRDEQNTRRLVLRWQKVIAQKIARHWCWRYLETYWSDPRDFPDPIFAREAFLYILHLKHRAPDGAVICGQEAIKVELKRWDELFASAPQ
jgi:hypothetical protein